MVELAICYNNDMELSIKKALTKHQKQINRLIEQFFDQKLRECSRWSADLKKVILETKKFSLQGGKRLRPILFLYGYQSIKPGNINRVLKVAISIEIMQSYFLVHDDIIDEDDQRRGHPSLHVVYEKIYSNNFGTKLSIIAGDILENFALEILAEANFPQSYINKALRQYYQITKNVNYGQVLDLLSERDKPITEREIFNILKLKTATYTTTGPLQLGATLAGASPTELKLLAKIGEPLGIVFQLRDDVLGLFSSQQEIGKPVGSDVKEGKKTLLIHRAWRVGDQKQRQILKKVLGNKSASFSDIKKVRLIVKETGALSYVNKIIDQQINKSLKAIAKSSFRTPAKKFLADLTQFIGQHIL